MSIKKLHIILFILLGVFKHSFGQDANSLMHLHSFTNEAAFSGITGTVAEGTMIYNEDNKRVYYYAGTTNGWTKLAISPSIIDKTAAHTLIASDDGNVLTFNTAADVTLTIPTTLPAGFNVSIYQKGAGQVEIVAGDVSITILNRLDRYFTAGAGAGVGIVALSATEFYITGDLKRM